MKHNSKKLTLVFVLTIISIYIGFFYLFESIGSIVEITGFAVDNQPPVIANIPDLILQEDRPYNINLNNYVQDDTTPDEDISWSHSNLDNLVIILYQNKTARITSKENWNGYENVIFTAIDAEGLSATDATNITITPTNDPLEIVDYSPDSENQLLETSIEVDFEVEAEDIDGDNITAKWYFDDILNGSGLIWTFTPSQLGNHFIKVIVTDGEFNDSHEWNVSIIALNTPPQHVKDLPSQEWDMNTNLTEVFDLDDYFNDPEGNSLEYSAEPNNNIIIKINKSNNKPGFYPRAGWFGTETTRFIADDGNLIKKSNYITLKVNSVDAPIPQQKDCNELWNCTRWQPAECPENETQIRMCYDLNQCGSTTRKPTEIRICIHMPVDDGKNKTVITKIIKNNSADKPSPKEDDKWKLIIFIIAIITLSGLLGVVAFEKLKSQQLLHQEKQSNNIPNTSLIRLTDYIRRELQQGFSQQQIKSKLLYEGWNEYIVNKAFSQLAIVRKAPVTYTRRRSSRVESMLNKKKESIHDKMSAFET